MSRLLVIAMPGNETMARALGDRLGADCGEIELREFPDGETYLRFLSELAGRRIVLVCTLAKPNDKLLPLLFAAATARELGAVSVGLAAPYLGYMRQDRRFKPGEAVTSRQVARLLSDAFDWLITVDPHLHRYGSLSELYSIPARAVHAAPLLCEWIKAHVRMPFVVGPDAESEQWVAAVAQEVGAPYTVFEKTRHGDREVSLSLGRLTGLDGRMPVLVDDIISSGRTMLEAVRAVRALGATSPVCIAVHGIFADESDRLLREAGARVVTSNSIPHSTNAIDIAPLLAAGIADTEAAAVTSQASSRLRGLPSCS